MKKPWLWASAAAGFVAYKVFRRKRRSKAPEGEDPRAAELRAKLDESRSIVEEREQFESAETPVDHVEEPKQSVEERRKDVHERGREAIDEMRPRDTG